VSISSGRQSQGSAGPSSQPSGSSADVTEPHVTVFDVVTDLRRDVAAVELPLSIEGSDVAAGQRSRLVDQLDDHLLPRLKELSSPAVVVIAGSTGAGKSTLLNSLLHEEVSEASVIRPTTREPVVVYNPQDAEVIEGTPLVGAVRSVANVNVPRGIALLDAPDLDSVLDENRETASRLLEGADLWLFVTTAARYGDALPWRTLEGAVERGATVAMVLNRAPKASLTTVRGDLLNRLREHRMESAPLFVVPDAGPHEGLLDASSVAPIERWLRTLGGADRARSVILRTLRGSLAALPPWVDELSGHVEAQHAAAVRLRRAADAALPPVAQATRLVVESGRLSLGAVETRWSQLTAPARLDKAISRSGLARGSARRGRSRDEHLEALTETVREAATAILTVATADARTALRDALEPLPGGAGLVPEVTEAQDDASALEAVDAWVAAARADIERIDESEGKQNAAAVRAFGRDGLTALLLASAVGLAAAEDLLGRLLGNAGRDLSPEVTSRLADAAEAAVLAQGVPVQTALDHPALADDAAIGLRVRLAELAQLT